MLFVGADHAGFALKSKLLKRLQEKQISFEDLGTDSEDSCDYPFYAVEVANRVMERQGNFGLLICGTGIGMSITANKISGIRAACVSEAQSAEFSRRHNDAQILCMGGRIVSEDVAWNCLEVFLNTPFDEDHPRHRRRLQEIERLEERGHHG